MKARLPKGMGGGPQNMNALIKQAQQMQDKMAEYQEALEGREFEASSGGGVVSVVMSGKKVLKSIKLAPEVVDPEDIEMLEDLIVAAVNEALRNADAMVNNSMGQITGGLNLNLPGGMF